MNRNLIASALVFVLLSACQSSSTQPASPVTSPAVASSAAVPAHEVATYSKPAPVVTPPENPIAVMAEWRHGLSKSRFVVGNVESQKSDSVAHAFVTTGDQGTYVESDKGWASGTSAPKAPARLKAPMSDFAKHRAMALAYFRGSGMQDDQINESKVFEATTLAGDGTPEGSTLIQVRTKVLRYLDGDKLVQDSIAWVSFNADGEVVDESVFWPLIPANVVDDARALQALHADPKQHAAFAEKVVAALAAQKVTITPDKVTGVVTVHHTDASITSDAKVSAYASYDVRGGQVTHHFLLDGTETK